jgi:hypothetical protein
MASERAFQHAWVIPHRIADESWLPLRRDATVVLRAASARLEQGRSAEQPGVLRGPHGLGLPQITIDRIAFNGSSFRGESADAFVLEQRASSGILIQAGTGRTARAVRRCDTSGQPYNLAVCALLLVAKQHLDDAMRLGSSGGLRDGWREAARLCREALGHAAQLVQSEHGLLRWVAASQPAIGEPSRSSA